MAGQDYPKRLEAGATQNVNISGDYIYCKFADRPFTVIMNGSRTTMVAGDKYRPGGFKEFEIENTDLENPIAIVLTIGEGDYTRQIIRGEITTAPGVRKADGTFVADTRFGIRAKLTPTYGYVGEVLAKGDRLQTVGITTGNENIESLWFDGSTVKAFTQMTFGNPDQARVLSIAPDGASFTTLAPPKGTSQGTTRLKPFDKVPDGYLFKDTSDTVAHKNRLWRWDDQAFPERSVYLSLGLEIIDHQQVGEVLYVLYDDNAGIRKIREYSVSDGPAFVRDIDTQFIVDATGAEPRTLAWNPVEKIFTVQTGYNSLSTFIAVLDANLNLLYVDGNTAFDFPGAGAGGSLFFIRIGGVYWVGFDQNVTKINAEEETLTLQGFASNAGCNVDLINDDYNATTTVAEVAVTSQNGRVIVEGELIRAFLEFYFNARMAADYMDHVYSVEIENPVSGAVTSSAGGRGSTLSALEIEDNFSAYFPAVIALSVDSTLQTISPINY